MNDLLKRLGVGVLIGLVVTMIVGTVVDKVPAISRFLDKYEYLSYDSRMKFKVSTVEEASIDTVVIIDIEQNSIEGLGNYFDWPHAYHGQLIDVVTSGNPKALLFDIILKATSGRDSIKRRIMELIRACSVSGFFKNFLLAGVL